MNSILILFQKKYVPKVYELLQLIAIPIGEHREVLWQQA